MRNILSGKFSLSEGLDETQMQGHQAGGDCVLPTHTCHQEELALAFVGDLAWTEPTVTSPEEPRGSFHSGKVLSDKNLISIISIWRRIKSACAHSLSLRRLCIQFWFPLTSNRHDPLLKESSSNWGRLENFFNT